MKVFCSWSGGKESSLACYKAILGGFDISFLLNMVSEGGERSRSHGLDSRLLAAQSEAIGIPITQRKTTWDSYENEFKESVTDLKKHGIEGGVFGDIDLQAHRDWVERVCRESDIKAFEPLWKKDREYLLKDLIGAGFKAIVVVAKSEFMDSGWLGRSIDEEFINDVAALKNVDLCGEAGEYHTFITDGPIFRKKIEILNAKKIQKDDYWFLDIKDYRIKSK
jgi:diphthine-ammonia ligase